MAQPVRLEPLPRVEFPGWAAAVRARFADQRVQSGTWSTAEAPGRAEQLLTQLLPDGLNTPGHRVWAARQGPTGLGWAWLRVEDATGGGDGFLFDVALTPGASGRGLGPVVMDAVETAAAASGVATVWVLVFTADTATAALVLGRGYHPAATQMRLRLTEPSSPGPAAPRPGVRLEPMTPPGYAAFRADQQTAYAGELRDSGTAAPESAATRAAAELGELLPAGGAPPGQLLWTAWDGDQQVGHLWLEVTDHHDGPRAFVYDVAVTAGLRRRGYGRAVIAAAEHEARRRGCTCMVLSVFGTNHAALGLYDSLGYQPTEDLLLKTFPPAR